MHTKLQHIQSNTELSKFIASKITDKFRFVDKEIEDATDFTNDLLTIAQNGSFSTLRSEKSENNSLVQSTNYLIKGSGLFPLLFKIRRIWGEDAEKEFLKRIYEIYQNYYIKKAYEDRKLLYWIRNNKKSLESRTLDCCFINFNYFSDINDLEIKEEENEIQH